MVPLYDGAYLEDGAWILLRLRRSSTYSSERPWSEARASCVPTSTILPATCPTRSAIERRASGSWRGDPRGVAGSRRAVVFAQAYHGEEPGPNAEGSSGLTTWSLMKSHQGSMSSHVHRWLISVVPKS